MNACERVSSLHQPTSLDKLHSLNDTPQVTRKRIILTIFAIFLIIEKSKSTTFPVPSSNSYESRMSIVRAFLDKERQKEAVIQAHIEVEKEQQQVLQNMQAMPGSSSNPIVIEKDDKEDFPPLIPYQCQMSTIPTYRPTCEKCGQLGYEEPTCTMPLRMYVKCEYCAWLKGSQHLCMHFDMSPKRLRYLRRRLRMPENPDY